MIIVAVAVGAHAPSPHAVERRRDASLRAFGAIFPRLAPDGRDVVFSYQGAIWRMAVAGGPAHRLTASPTFDITPAWSPDARRIAYDDGWFGHLRVIDAATGTSVPLPASVAIQGPIAFDRSGMRVLTNVRVAADGASGSSSSLYALSWFDLANGTRTSLLDMPTYVPVFASCGDGRVIYATSQDPPGDPGGEQTGVDGPETDLWIVGENGHAPVHVSTFPSRVYDMTCAGDDVVLSSDVGGAHTDLWRLSLRDASHPARLTTGGADEAEPSLSSDRGALLYSDNREGSTTLVLRDADGDERVLRPASFDFGAPAGRVHVRITDRGQPATARLSLVALGGKAVAPPASLYFRVDGVDYFYADGEAYVDVPAGRYELRAARGMEYRTVSRAFTVPPAGESIVDVALDRWTDPASRGWWGGESHIHANYGYGHWYQTPATIARAARGEGLNVANLLVANSDGDGVFDREFFRGAPDPASTPAHTVYWNEEFRSTLWGHMTLFGLTRLVEPIFTGFLTTTHPHDVPTNGDVADAVHEQGGLVDYTHPAPYPGDPFMAAYSAKGLPVDVARGKIDVVDINLFAGAVPLWYRLLNCGFTLPASAGTDAFLNRVRTHSLAGAARAYVRIDGPFSYTAYTHALASGRSFVTDGPMLDLDVAGRSLGDTVALDAPGSVRVRGTATWQRPLRAIELVMNGRVVATGALAADRRSAQIDRQVPVTDGGWVSLRTYAEGGEQAHTSALYLTVAGRRFRSADDARFFLTWIDRLDARLRARGRIPAAAAARVAMQMNAARAVYRDVAAHGTTGGGLGPGDVGGAWRDASLPHHHE